MMQGHALTLVVDTATGFSIAELESNVEGFFADTHTVEFPVGAVRGQLMWQDYYY